MGDCFSIIPAAQRGTAFAGATGDHHGNACVMRAGPHYCFSQPRNAVNRHSRRVNAFVRFQIVHGAAQSPGPGGDGAPFVGSRLGLARFQEMGAHTELQTAREVRVWISPVIDSAEAEPLHVKQTNDVDFFQNLPPAAGIFLLSGPHTSPGRTPGSFTVLEFAEKPMFNRNGTGPAAWAGR